MIKNWLLAFRPKTLTAALVPVLAATAMAWSTRTPMNWWVLVCALMSSILIQIGTNLVNDGMDFKKGADTEKRLGPKRVTQSGDFTFKTVMTAAAVSFALSIVFGIPLVYWGGWPIVIIGLFSVAMGYAYTSGPMPLAYHGLGDLFVVLFFGVVAVLGMEYLYLHLFSIKGIVLGLQIGLLSAVLIAINNIRDMDNDAQVNKKTLAVRLGLHRSRWLLASYVLVPFLLLFYWAMNGYFWVFLLPWILIPKAYKLLKQVFQTKPGVEYNKYLGEAAMLHLFFGVFICLGFLL